MYEQQLINEASQLANSIERGDFQTASNLLRADTQGVLPSDAQALVTQTNMYTQQDGQNNGYQYDQIVPSGLLDQYGFPIVNFVSGNGTDASVPLEVAQPQYQAPPPEYVPGPPPGYVPGAQPYYGRPADCGQSALGGAAIGAALGALLGGRYPGRGAGIGALFGGAAGAAEGCP